MLFASFKYHISPSFPSTRIEELKHVLDHNGAHEVSGEAWLNEVNLVVSNSMKFEGWEEVKERNESRKLEQGEGEEEKEEVYIVTDKWVDRSLVLGKIQSLHHYSPDPSLIFSGIIACATSLPPSDLEVLSAGITALGGQWRTGLTKDVTHLFAMSPDSQKYATAMHFREETGIKVILPHWFDDVVRLGMGGLNTDVYEWPDPELLKNPLGVGGGGGGGRGQELSGVKKNMYAMAALFTAPMHDSSSPPLKDLEMATAAGSRMEVDIWKGKKIVLSRTLQLFKGRREAVQIGIERAGGVVVRYDGDEEVDEGFAGEGETSKREKERRRHEADKILESDVLVTRWRDGAAYVAALRSHKTIGTLAWLFHVQSTGTLTRPLDQLLHYPVPKRPIEAFSNHVITVTNYTGEAREYLKKLIIAMGAKFTPSMSGQNTVLIAAYTSGTKSAKAQSWSIPIVNHTWLEDCFIQWRNLTVGLDKYIGFPTGVDFSRLLGVRGVGGVVEVHEEGLEEEAGGEPPGGTDASVREVQGLIVSEDVDMRVRGEEEDPVEVMMDVDGAEDERTPTKQTYTKPSTSKHMVNGRDTSPAPVSIFTSPRKSPGNESEGEEGEAIVKTKTNGKQTRKTNHRVSPPEEEEEEEEEATKPTHIRKQTQKQKTARKNNRLASSSEDEIENEEDGDESEVISSKIVKANSKGRNRKQKPEEKVRSRSKKSKDEDDSEVEVVSSKIAKTNLNGKGKEKVIATRSKKYNDEDMEVVVEDEEEEEEEEEEEVSSRTKSKKINSKEKRSTKSKSKSRGQDTDAMDEDHLEQDEEDEEEEENPKSKGASKVGRKRKFIDDDEEDDDEEGKDSPMISKSKPKTKAKAKVTTPVKYTSPTKPTLSSKLSTTSAKRKSKVLASGDPEDDSEDEIALTPARAINGKLIRRVSGVVPDDKRTSLSDEEVGKKRKEKEEEEEEEDVHREEKAKPRPSLIDRNQAKKGDARTRVRKRKIEIEVESDDDDEEEEEEPVVPVKSTSSSKGKLKAKSASAKKKARVQHSDDDDEENDDDDDKPQQQPSKTKTKKSVKESMNTKANNKSSKPTKAKPTSEEELEQPTDSDSDLPAAPFLSLINKNKGKRVSTDGPISKSKKPVASTSTSVSAAKSKSAAAKSKSNAKAKAMVESEDEDDVNVNAVPSTPKRSISVLMPSFNLSGNKKKGSNGDGASASVKAVEKSRKGKKAKLSVSSEEDDKDEDEEPNVRVSPRNRAITRTESIRVMSSHQVQVSVKHPAGAALSSPASAVVKKNANAITSSSQSKSKPTNKSTPMDIDSPLSSSPLIATSTKTKSPSKTKPSPILKRSAAAKATQRLRDTIMPDLVHFESQMKRANAKGRKSDGMSAFKVEGEGEGGKAIKRSQDGEEERVSKRRKVDDDDDVGESVSVRAKGKGKRKVRENGEEEEEEDGAKKRTLAKGKGKTVVFVSDEDRDTEDEEDGNGRDDVVVSSSKGGVGAKAKHKGVEKETPSKSGVVLLTTQVTLSDDVIKALTKLGVKMTSRPSECTHLLAPHLVRTEKFLCALVVAPFILTDKWAIRSAAVKKLLPEKGFALHDISGENKYGVDLTQSLRRAKELGGKLLAGQTFYVTPKVPVDTKLLKNVVIACGGQISTQQPTVRIISASPQTRHVISCKEDITIWRPMAAQGIPIYSQELLLTAALKQEIEWDADGVRVDID